MQPTNPLLYAIPQWLIASKVYMVVIIGLDGRYSYVNDLFKKQFSFLGNDFTGMSIEGTVIQDDVLKCTIAGQKALENPGENVEVRLRKPKNQKGEYNWSQWEFSAYKNQENEIIGILAVGHDISKLENLQRKTKKIKEKTDAIIENITDGFFVLDTHWRFVKINRIAEKLFNIPIKSLIRKNIWDISPNNQNYKYHTEFRKAVENRVATNFEEYDEGRDRWYNVVAYPSDRGLTVFFKDITSEKKSQEGLKNSENKLKAILESTNNGMVLISPDFQILSFNQVANNITFATFHKNLEEGKNFKEFLFKDTEDDFLANFNKALKGEVVVLERLYQIGTQNIWYDIYYFPVYDFNTKNIIGVAINSVDINIKKQAQEALRISENKLRAISESATNSNVLISPTYKILYFNKIANDIAMSLWNVPLEEYADFRLFIPSGAEQDFEDSFHKAIKGENVIIERQRKVGEREFYFEVNYFPVYEPTQNQIIGVALNTIDVSVRKQTQKALIQSQYMLNALYNSTQDACVFLGTDLKIMYSNKMAQILSQKLFGKICQVGDNIMEYIYPHLHKEFEENFEKIKKGENLQFEQSFNESWWCFTIIPVCDTEHTLVGIAMNVADITARKTNEEKILTQNDILKDIAWQQSHALRRPLASILSLVRLIQEEKSYNEVYFDYLYTSARQLDEVIHRIVAFAEKIELELEELGIKN